MTAADVVPLPGGLTLPLAVVELALDLERRGVTLRTEDGAVLLVGPPDRPTADDRAGLTRWKPHLLALLDALARHEATR